MELSNMPDMCSWGDGSDHISTECKNSHFSTNREMVTGIVRMNQDFPCLGDSPEFPAPYWPLPWDSDPLHQSSVDAL